MYEGVYLTPRTVFYIENSKYGVRVKKRNSTIYTTSSTVTSKYEVPSCTIVVELLAVYMLEYEKVLHDGV